MRWLERTRRQDIAQPTPTEPLKRESAAVATVAARSIEQRGIDYADALPGAMGSWRRLPALLFKPFPSFLAFVVVPSIAIGCYYSFIAADQYVVTSHFVVRQVEDTSFVKGTISSATVSQAGAADKTGESGPISSGATKSAIKPNDGDAYVVASYIASGAAIDNISQDLNLTKLFRRPEADFLARLPADAPQEQLQRYWLDMVSAYVDGPTGIVTLQVRAFRREDALMLANDIIASATRLVNDMSLRARKKALERAKQEVGRADKSLQSAMTALAAYQNRVGLIDPINTATNTGDLLKQLLGQRIAIDSELYVTKKMRPGAPTIPALKERLKAVDSRIAELRGSLTNTGRSATRTISAALVGFDGLQVKERLAEEMYVDARTAEEDARQSAERRWLYLAVFDPPALPDDSEYPLRVGFSAIGFVVFLSLWSIAALVWASVLDHRA